ncbi:hypothetical protein BD310DRAFT_913103 [Dichomitus squalens]|uniref:Uncharacterized protein n=1 Tax=Dichomitus squalens TaxID=114155 RepID=A0A4Q9QC66_9APHY|nr:hypothetical protein BD310DRAFT_913103 [Dichomitus squalens]
MSPMRTTRWQMRASAVPLPSYRADPPSSRAPSPTIASQRLTPIKKVKRRKQVLPVVPLGKQQVLADRSSRINEMQDAKRRRASSFHPASASLSKGTPVRSKMIGPGRRTRPSNHVRWVDNANGGRVPLATVRHYESQDNGLEARHVVRPRPILTVYRDTPPATPQFQSVTSDSENSSSSTLCDQTPSYTPSPVPSGVTLRSRRGSSRASLQSARLDSSLVDDSDTSADDSTSGGSFDAGPSTSTRLQAIRPTEITPHVHEDATSSRALPRSVAPGLAPHRLAGTSTFRACRSAHNTWNAYDARVYPSLHAFDDQDARRWLPRNRANRYFLIFCMVYTPVLLPLLARALGLV